MLRHLSLTFLSVCIFGQVIAMAGPNDSNLTTREQQVLDQQKNREESARTSDALKPNERSSPTKVDVSSWGLSDAQIAITNHLFGYSTIMDPDYTLQGVKITGLVNLGFYAPNKNNDGERKKGRFVFGMEFPTIDLTSRSDIFFGAGLTMMDASSGYIDAGIEYHILSWFKAQAGVNYNFARKAAGQASLGLTW